MAEPFIAEKAYCIDATRGHLTPSRESSGLFRHNPAASKTAVNQKLDSPIKNRQRGLDFSVINL